MKYVDEFRDGQLAREIAARIHAEADPARQYNLMEFCGGHTHAIFRYGLPDLLPSNVRMIHGPGCPVCVLPINRLDSAIELRGLPVPLADAMDEALGHLVSTRLGTAPVICTLFETSHGFELTEGDRVIDRCSALDAVVPMVKAAIVRVAIDRATAFAIVHAATVCRDGSAVVLPGPAASGKSTLAASLMLDGWTLAADDITILGHDTPFHVRPLPTALCLKTDSWPVVVAKAPEVDCLPIHRRTDGQSVRYLPPRSAGPGTATAASVGVGLIAFPQYRAEAPLKVRRLNVSEVFDRFLPQFYPVSNRFEGETMERLIGFIRQVEAIELCYGDGAAAAEAVRNWA